MLIKELEIGTPGVVECVIAKIEQRDTKKGQPYLYISVSDGNEQVEANMWDTTKENFKYEVGQVVFATLKAEKYNGGITYRIMELVESSSDPAQFVMSAPIDAKKMYDFLYRNAGKCGVYAKTVQEIMADNKDKLMVWGAAKNVHHNIRSGLLYHTYRMVKVAAYIASVYNKEPSMYHTDGKVLNSELLIAGAILHDIGKIWEIETDNLGMSDYTVAGNLKGHLYIGAEVVGQYARKNNVPEEDIMLLQHMVLSHHGEYEFQAVALPAIPEAMILHEVDVIDSKLYQYEAARDKLEPGTMSDRVFGLGLRVYRPTYDAPQPEAKAAEQ